MFKTALLASTLLISATTAYASVETTGRYDAWVTYAGTARDGRPICGASVKDDDRRFDIKYQTGSLFVHLTKGGWDIPEKTPIKFTMQIDHAAVWKLNGLGHRASDGSSYIEFDFDSNEIAPSGENTVVEFTNLIMNGLNVRFQFPDGSEPDWIGSLRGSADAMDALDDCIGVLDAAATPSTQPFSGNSTQPFKGGATQPFARE
jgi:hypothetical protein